MMCKCRFVMWNSGCKILTVMAAPDTFHPPGVPDGFGTGSGRRRRAEYFLAVRVEEGGGSPLPSIRRYGSVYWGMRAAGPPGPPDEKVKSNVGEKYLAPPVSCAAVMSIVKLPGKWVGRRQSGLKSFLEPTSISLFLCRQMVSCCWKVSYSGVC